MPRKKPEAGSSKPVKPQGESARDDKAAAEAAREKERRAFVETMAGYGMPLEELGLLLVPPVSKADLEARYAREIEIGKAKGKAKVVDWVWASAEKGNVTARVYLHKLLLPERLPLLPAPEVPNSQEAPAESNKSTSLMPDADATRRILNFPGPK